MLRMLIAMMALTLALPATAQPPIDDSAFVQVESAIKAAMLDSAEGWNRGDIDRFLAIYSDDPATSFTGSDGVAWSKRDIRARYLKSYSDQFGPSRAAPSTLSFTFESLRLIGGDHALLIARWKLVKANGEIAQGLTSLLFHKEGANWRIIADHSS